MSKPTTSPRASSVAAPISDDPIDNGADGIRSKPVTMAEVVNGKGKLIAPSRVGSAIELARRDEDVPEDFISLGSLPYEHFWYVQKDAVMRGELLTIARRMEQDPEEEDGVMRLRESFVVRNTIPVICAKTVKDLRNYEPIGEIIQDPITTRNKDVYTVEPGNLVAFDVRRTLHPLVPFAFSKQAAEIFVKCTGRQAAQRGNNVYWTFAPGAKPLGRARDTSLDFLAKQADTYRQMEEAPFLL